ncbi:MAG: MBL fold metallo-hydrolase, partial [Akkermansiaceae bacterium]
MRFSILGSGSTGNSTIIECGTTRVLIDAGLSAKQILSRLESIGIDPASISAILLTHEHGDHVRGLKSFIKKYPVP